jgi:hypothetical protein
MNLTAESIREFRDYLRKNPEQADRLRKAGGITQSTGLVFYDLQTPSEKAIPLITPLRLKIPRVAGHGDTSHRWKAIFGLDGTTSAQVGEGHRGAAITTTVVPLSAAYAGLGVENPVTWEARYASVGFEDVRATAMQLAIYSLQQKEEWQIIGGMQSYHLGQTGTVTPNTATTGGSIAAGTYYLQVVPLNLWAYKNTTLAAGVTAQISGRANTDGTTDTINGGCGIASAQVSQVTTGSTSTISASWPSTPGAVAYAVYAGLSGAVKLQAIVTAPTITLASISTAYQNITAWTSTNDYSYNNEANQGGTVLDYDGLMSYAANYASNGMYWQDAAGTSFTSDGEGGVTQITNMLVSMFNNYKLGPTDLWVNAAQGIQIRNLCSANGSQPLVRMVSSGQSVDDKKFVAGYQIPDILNPFPTVAPSIQVHVHPDIPAGTVIATSSQLPYQIQDLQDGPIVIRERQPYYGIQWPQYKRLHEMGVYVDANVELHVPFAFGVVQGLV